MLPISLPVQRPPPPPPPSTSLLQLCEWALREFVVVVLVVVGVCAFSLSESMLVNLTRFLFFCTCCHGQTDG